MTDIKTRKTLIELIKEATHSGARKIKSCKIIDLEPRTLERWISDKIGDKRSIIEKNPSNKLSESERKDIINVCCSDEYKDKTPNEIVPLLADKRKYMASESTIYRILKAANLLKHRSESKPRKKRNKPDELKATGPNQVWSWDITYLLSSIKGQYFYLYLFMDVWSRRIVGWDIHEKESEDYAASLMTNICATENIKTVALHSDNGSPMKGATMLATLQNLGVVPSFSRAHVSDDNPYSESLFKTLKYKETYPRIFETIEFAKEWVSGFADWYNNEHLHSGIKFVTPMQRHTGRDKAILENRKATYLKAKSKHPERWSKNIRNWDWQEIVYLNPNKKEDLLTKKVS